jgi:hypothetical protein
MSLVLVGSLPFKVDATSDSYDLIDNSNEQIINTNETAMRS